MSWKTASVRRNRDDIRLIESLRSANHRNHHLGFALWRLGRLDEAMASYTEGLRLDPGLAEAHSNLGALPIETERFAESVPYLVEAVRLDPDLELARMNLGLALTRAGRTDEALLEFEQALRINPGNPLARRAVDERRKTRREQ
jgi:tetratricopeptide (TPR) repeat protein